MKSIKLIIALAAIMVLPISAMAQNGYYFSINYNPSLPIGDVADFTGDFAWRGVGVDGRFFVDDNVSIGFFTGWEVFREESDGVVSRTVQLDDATATISAKEFRFTNSVPLLLTSHYHWGDKGDARPYAGLGAGLYYITQRVEMGLYSVEDNTTRFGLSPTIGVILPAFYDASLNLGLQYHQAFGVDDYNPVSYLSFNIGLTWGD